MKPGKRKETGAVLVEAVRIAVGSGAAMYAASLLHLEFAASAGMVTLLTILTTKWETLRLSAARILTFFLAAVLAWLVFSHIKSDGAAFGIFIFLLVLISEWVGWRITASVNAVIGTHFLTTRNFSIAFIANEFLIVFLGVTIAIIINLFQNNGGHRDRIIENMRYTEQKFSDILGELAVFLYSQDRREAVWEKLELLEQKLEDFIEQAYVYQNNTFRAHTSYYSAYFEMREKQCGALQHLHHEMEKLKALPKQSFIVADYISYLKHFVKEMNRPEKQLARLAALSEEMKAQELPGSREEFENRAVLYHILMDLEEFLQYKQHFVERIDETQFAVYWKKEVEDFRRSKSR